LLNSMAVIELKVKKLKVKSEAMLNLIFYKLITASL